jgi:hypothetical protein
MKPELSKKKCTEKAKEMEIITIIIIENFTENSLPYLA